MKRPRKPAHEPDQNGQRLKLVESVYIDDGELKEIVYALTTILEQYPDAVMSIDAYDGYCGHEIFAKVDLTEEESAKWNKYKADLRKYNKSVKDEKELRERKEFDRLKKKFG